MKKVEEAQQSEQGACIVVSIIFTILKLKCTITIIGFFASCFNILTDK